MSDKTVLLVTGASTGLGVSVAVQAARAGHTVYATMRNLSRRQQLDDAATAAGVTLEVLQLDVASPTDSQSAVEKIVDEQGHIDCVVANAGVGYVRTTEQSDEQEIMDVLNTNLMGVIRSVKAALPHMRAKNSGRFIAVSSVGGLVGQPFNEIYCASKFALEGYFESLASYVTPAFGVHFTLVEPGGIVSEFANTILKKITETGGFPDDDYKPLIEKYVGGRATRNVDGVFQTADEVASVVMKCLEMPDPPVRIRTSEWAESFTSLKTGQDPDGKLAQAMVFDSMIGDD